MNHMKEKEDRLMSDIMKDFRMETPPEGFTQRVMQRVRAQGSITSVKSTPLIGRAGWIGIAVFVSLLLVLIFIVNPGQSATEPGWIGRILHMINFPEFDSKMSNLFGWVSHDHHTLFWIFLGIAGLFMLVFLERLFENLKVRIL